MSSYKTTIERKNEVSHAYIEAWRMGERTRATELGKEQFALWENYVASYGQDCALLKPLCKGGCSYGGPGDLRYPKDPAFRSRITLEEFRGFRAEMEQKLYEVTPNCVLIQFMLGIPLMFACCLNMQLAMWRPHVLQANVFHETVAKYNKYLFKPRGVKATVEVTEITLNIGSDNPNQSSGDSVSWYIFFDTIDPATPEAVELTIPTVQKPDTPPKFCGPMGCCVPDSHYFTNEEEIICPELESKFNESNKQFQMNR